MGRSTKAPGTSSTTVADVSIEALTAGARKTADNMKISVTDVIMVVKKCTRNNASKMLRQLREEERIPELEMRVFSHDRESDMASRSGDVALRSGRGNYNPEAAADIRQIVQILWALPGDSAFRRKSADVVVRYLGGDERIVEEVLQNREAQAFLAREQPDHPARVFGEAVEAEERARAARGNGECEIEEQEHKRQRRTLELKELQLRVDTAEIFKEKELAEKEKVLAEKENILQATQAAKDQSVISNVKAWAEAAKAHPESLAMSDADRVRSKDVLRTVALGGERPDGRLGRAVCIETFLRCKGETEAASLRGSFGTAVSKEWKRANPGEVQPKKAIFVNGQEQSANAYWEKDLPLIETTYVTWKAKLDARSNSERSSSSTPGSGIRAFMRPSA